MELKNKYNPKVSIVIPAYNASNYLEEAIESALAQTYENIEIIVINDGSKDNGATAEIAKKYGDKISYYEKPNGGSSSALNYGIEKMSGEWFSWLSHDDLYYSNKVEEQIKYLNEMKITQEEMKNTILFAGVDYIDFDGKYIRKAKKKTLKNTEQTVNHIKGNEYLVAEPTKYNYHGCTCMVHKSVFEQVGKFDENLRLVNDWDMWFRIYINNFHISFVPLALVKGRVHKEQISRSIGFSYHNKEQDMFWKRSLMWLNEYALSKQEVFYLFGKNAFLKTRFIEGEEAFNILKGIQPNRKTILLVKKIVLKMIATIKEELKKVYLKLRV